MNWSSASDNDPAASQSKAVLMALLGKKSEL